MSSWLRARVHRLVGFGLPFYVGGTAALGAKGWIMAGRLNRFLGDTPLRVLFRLLVLSFLVGLVLSFLNIRPLQLYWWIERLIARIWAMGFEFIGEAFEYLLVGALVVVPIFLLMRLLSMGRGRGRAE